MMMTIQQTVDIPADRKLHLDLELPETVPTGHTEVQITFSPAPAKVGPKLGMLTTEQLKTLLGSGEISQSYNKEILERREAIIDLAWQYGKPHQEHSLFKHAGCLKDSGVFDGDAMEIQKEMRREWER
jgi:hypothetical protein